MVNIILQLAGAVAVVIGFGFLALYSNKIINAMVLSKDFMNKWYYKLFGKTLKNLQVSLTDCNSIYFLEISS